MSTPLLVVWAFAGVEAKRVWTPPSSSAVVISHPL